jgi:protein-disulfide isomerase
MNRQHLAVGVSNKKRLVGSFIACAIAVWLGFSGQGVAQSSVPVEQERIEQIVHDYLLKHPEVIVEALQAAEAKDKQKQEEASRAAIAEKRKELLDDATAPTGGNPKGDVTVVEFFDYRCPYCKRVEPSVEALLKEDAQLRIVYKEFPILGPPSVFAAHVAFAALKQGKYERFHTAMMATKGESEITENVVLKVAADAGLDVAQVKTDMTAPEIEQIIKRNYELADALGIRGTPAFVIGDTLIPGAADLPTLKQTIAAARKVH